MQLELRADVDYSISIHQIKHTAEGRKYPVYKVGVGWQAMAVYISEKSIMMKTLATILISNLIIIALSAQPKISESWVPQVGDEWRQSVTLDTPSVGESGANVTWDYSNLSIQGFQFDIAFNWIEPASTPYIDSFPDATVCAELGAFGGGTSFSVGYYQSDESGFRHLGSGNQYGTNIFMNPQAFDFIGMSFEQTVVDSYEVIHYSTFASPRMSLGATSFTYDAYGTLILPTATIHDAIRIFQIDVETDSTENYGVANARVDSLVTYAWIAEGSIFPVAMWQRSTSYERIYVNGDLINENIEEPTIVFAINPDYGKTSALARQALPILDVFPTIARDELNIEFDDYSSLEYSIHSMDGRPVDNGRLNGDVTAVDVAQFVPGYYVLSVDGFAPYVFLKME